MAHSILQPSWVKSTKSTRFVQLERFYRDRKILDIGCAVGYQKDDWMFRNIKAVAKSIRGIDLDAESVSKIREMGFDIEVGNAQSFDVNDTFDLVHAGELIEHLDNPGGFLDSAKKHMATDGRLLITTPNALRISNFLYAATGGLRVNAEHTCWFCEYTLKTLLERKGFEVVEYGYLRHTTFNAVRKTLLALRSMVLPDRVAWNTLYVVARIAR